MTLDLCSFEILTYFSESTDGFLGQLPRQFSLNCNQEGPFQQCFGILVRKLPLLSKSADISLVRSYCQLISFLSKILLTMFWTNGYNSIARLTSIILEYYHPIPLLILHFGFLKLLSRLMSSYMP